MHINASKEFYATSLGAGIVHEYLRYVIFDFFGHQLVCHLEPNKVDKEVSRYPGHFGVILKDKECFDRIYQNAIDKNLRFYEKLFERFQEQPGWHWSFF